VYAVRLIFFLLLFYIGFRIVQGYLRSRDTEEKTLPPATGEETHRDPVCGVYVAQEDAVVGRMEGERVYFCSMACLEKYKAQIERKG
jgi:YHS domain-containing protein